MENTQQKKTHITVLSALIILILIILICGQAEAQPTGVAYQNVWMNVITSSATIPTTAVIKNTGQVSHQLVWSFATRTGGSFSCPTKLGSNIGSPPYVNNYFTFFIEGSFNGITYQRLNSITQLMRYEADSTINPNIVPALSGNLVVNSSAPYIRVGFTNNTGVGTGTDIFSDCALSANYIGTNTYNATLGVGGEGDSTDTFVRLTTSSSAVGFTSFIAPIAFGSWTTSKWINRNTFYVYALVVCNTDVGLQSITFSGNGSPGKFSLFGVAQGCINFPYTGKALFKVTADTGLGVVLQNATFTAVSMMVRLENKD